MFAASILAGFAAFGGMILALALAVITLVRGLFIPTRYIGGRCGSCGHGVEFGQRGATCPECGQSLLESGVVTRPLAARFRSGPALMHIAWLVICLMVVTVLGYAGMIVGVSSMGGAIAMGSTTTTFYAAPNLPVAGGAAASPGTGPGTGPGSTAPYQLYISETSQISGATGSAVETIEVQIFTGGQTLPGTLTLDGATPTWTLYDAQDAQAGVFTLGDGTALVALLEQAGIGPGDAGEGVEASGSAGETGEGESEKPTPEEAIALLLDQNILVSLNSPFSLPMNMGGTAPGVVATAPTAAGTQSTVIAQSAAQNATVGGFTVTGQSSTFAGGGASMFTDGLWIAVSILGFCLMVYVGGAIGIEIRRRSLRGGLRGL